VIVLDPELVEHGANQMILGARPAASYVLDPLHGITPEFVFGVFDGPANGVNSIISSFTSRSRFCRWGRKMHPEIRIGHPHVML
jgi:hypothetical protein